MVNLLWPTDEPQKCFEQRSNLDWTYHLKIIILAVVLTMDLREDVCPGGDGHSEGGEEWRYLEYNE